ncbi:MULTISPECIES: hypothetical protein [Nocardia]|uniref:hypothetical protein n=1 Tax=Nocardia TaxID=1817 RepID=UPI0018954D58|nr:MULTISPECIES: hypothetical protein [Nocardia]MBF6351888.1 hypothetical protein [Nocardia flavorosea]
MTLFEVRVTPYGESSFMIGVPGFGVTRFVETERELEEQARRLIAGCGAAPKLFDIEIVWLPKRRKHPFRAAD